MQVTITEILPNKIFYANIIYEQEFHQAHRIQNSSELVSKYTAFSILKATFQLRIIKYILPEELRGRDVGNVYRLF